jgi:uridine phosphorylase
MKIAESELILNADGSVYHLHLLPEDIGDTIILVGDQERVPEVSKHFDQIFLKKQHREFITHTGRIGSNRISVISTGIGTDTIDIVLNELDQLCNIDLQTRALKSSKQDLNLIRVGTSGALQADIAVDSILLSTHGLGLDGLLWYYQHSPKFELGNLQEQLGIPFVKPYIFEANSELLAKFDNRSLRGITATCQGFYAPQGRSLRKQIVEPNLPQKLSEIRINNQRITNFEMETAAILGLSEIFGFKAISVNAILANRINHTFSLNPNKIIENAIVYTLDSIF